MKNRNVKIELLRIVSMIMVIIGHTIVHGNLIQNSNSSLLCDYTQLAYKFMNILVIPATNVFVIISGYFALKSNYSLKRILLLWSQVFFFSLITYIITVLFDPTIFSFKNLLKVLMPISFGQYWFFTVYFCLIVFSPFLNILLEKLSKNGYQFLLFLFFLFFSITGSIPGIYNYNPQAGNGIIWFVVLYSVGGYLRRFPPRRKKSTYVCLIILFYLISFVGTLLLTYLSFKMGFEGKGISRLSTFETFPIFFVSIFIVCFTLKDSEKDIENINTRKFILFFSKSVFSIYLIHENSIIRSFLWEKVSTLIFINNNLCNIVLLPILSVAIFIISAIIDNLTWNKIKKRLYIIDTSRIDSIINGWLDV